MAKKSAVERDKKRRQLAKRYAAKRARLKAIALDESLSMEERFAARMKLAELPRILSQAPPIADRASRNG